MTPRSKICQDYKGPFAEYIISPIGGFGADSGLHPLVLSHVGAKQNQHNKKSTPLTKDSKPPKIEKDKGEDLKKSGESLTAQARPCML